MDNWRDYTLPNGNVIQIPPEVRLEFVTHPDAPLFVGDYEAFKIIDEVVAKLEAKDIDDRVLELLRQASLTSLWFFEKYILGTAGPYDKLTDHLHVSMCNYRQKLLKPGERGAMLVPRSCYKTTVGTHGANTWEIVRNPNIRIGIVGATKPDARRFSDVVKANFEQNDLLRLLFPDHAPERNAEGVITQDNWTQDSFISPARTRYFPEPTVKILGAGGATAGNHFDLLNIDDLVGEQQLNADHIATADMLKAKNWFMNNADTLLQSPDESRIFLSATRYAVDDAYDWIAEDANMDSQGYFEELPEECQPSPEGRWNVYYRQAIEYDLPIFPEKISKDFLARLKVKNPWGYLTQYNNNPYSAAFTELADYEPGYFDLNYDHRTGFTIHIGRSVEREEINLNDCIVSMGIDPAASDRKKSERTSRSAIVVQAKDCHERHFILDASAGYWTPDEFIERLFLTFKKFFPHVKRTNLEKMGAFAIFYNNVLRAQQEKQIYLGLYPITGGGDKDTKIRNFYQPLLEKKLFFLNNSIRDAFMDELRVFPGGTKKDIMDAGVLADDGVGIPRDPEARSHSDNFKARKRKYASKVTGA